MEPPVSFSVRIIDALSVFVVRDLPSPRVLLSLSAHSSVRKLPCASPHVGLMQEMVTITHPAVLVVFDLGTVHMSYAGIHPFLSISISDPHLLSSIYLPPTMSRNC